MINMEFGVTCVFTVEKFNKDGDITYKGEPFFNTVLDCGLFGMYSDTISTLTNYVNIGTGYDTPNISQTGLTSQSYSTNNKFASDLFGTSFFPKLYSYLIRVYQFNIGTCTGDFTEVGLSKTSNAGYFNRQLFKDADGNQIIVRVAADEGLRITAEIRLYSDPSLIPFSKVYKLDLKGATAGNITLSNGTKSYTFSCYQLSNAGDFKYHFVNIESDQSIVWLISGDILNGYNIYISPVTMSDYNISIVSHTLTGGTGEPELFVLQEYNSNCRKFSTISIDDETNGTSIEYELMTTVSFNGVSYPSKISESNIAYWAFFRSGGYDFFLLSSSAMNNVCVLCSNLKAAISATTRVEIETPELGKNYVIKKFYYAPGKLGTGTVSIKNIIMGHGDSPSMYATTFIDPVSLSVTDIEEFEIVAKISWGRYEQ